MEQRRAVRRARGWNDQRSKRTSVAHGGREEQQGAHEGRGMKETVGKVWSMEKGAERNSNMDEKQRRNGKKLECMKKQAKNKSNGGEEDKKEKKWGRGETRRKSS